MGGLFGDIAKFGPWANRCFWASVSGVLDIFLTHLDVAVVVVAVSLELRLLPLWYMYMFWFSLFEWPPLFFIYNLSNLAFWQSKVFNYLASLVLLINTLLSSMTSWSNTLESLFINVPLCHCSISNVLLIVLILSFRRALLAFFKMFKPLGVLILLSNLMVTGIVSLPRHHNENILWFLKLAILFSIFSNIWRSLTLSCPYSCQICKCMFLILFCDIFKVESGSIFS